MPRRGEHQREFPEVDRPCPPAGRVGIRAVRAPDRTGVLREIAFDPGEFGCSRLAGEMADEWVDYIDICRFAAGTAATYRRAVSHFCRAVDALLADTADQASLVRASPDLAAALVGWERTLPAGYPAGSDTPAVLASAVRVLIERRAQHAGRPVATALRHLVQGQVGVARGAAQEVDEFSRRDKRALIRVAWTCAQDLDRRIVQGWALAEQGQHPGEDGWTNVANLLWGLAHQQVGPRDIRDNLPVIRQWPLQLRACIERPGRDGPY